MIIPDEDHAGRCLEAIGELTAKVGDGVCQAAFLFWVSIISIPSLNMMPWMTFGN
ncbi:MAG: hypothetical protein JKY41_15160, partial [Rhodobacteraceae bacterium]|nr:hypothetical protein [Paracoccaceae bacterium]